MSRAAPTVFIPGHYEGGELEDVGFFGTTEPSRSPTYTVTNYTADRTYDANASSVAELADVLGTLLKDLIAQGIISGSVT